MAKIDAKLVNAFRQETGAGIMECKKALTESNGNKEKAKDLLRKWGAGKSDKLAGRETKEGRIGAYVHSNGKIVGLVELTCETDFVAKNEAFQSLLKDLAVGVAGMAPEAIRAEDLPRELVEEEKKKHEAATKGKPPEIAEKILQGKMEKNLYSQKCLLHMPYPKEDEFKGTYGDFLKSRIALLKENITVRRIHRMELGG